MTDHRSIEWAIDIIGMCQPIRCYQGGMWFGHNNNFADATFVDYGAADAFAVAANSLPSLVKALEDADKLLELLGVFDENVIRQRIRAALTSTHPSQEQN